MNKDKIADKLLVDMGSRIYNKRTHLRLTQEELAEKANVTKQMISYAENGKTALRPESMVKLCTVLQISADYLLHGEPNNIDISYLQSKINQLEPNQFHYLENIIDNFVTFCIDNKSLK